MGYHVADPALLAFDERDPRPGEARGRLSADLTAALALTRSRARLRRYPAHTTGRRHADRAQEEVFVVVSGRLTMLVGEPAERVDVGAGGAVAVEAGTPLQARNEEDEELVMFVYGAPPEQAGADFFDDAPLPSA